MTHTPIGYYAGKQRDRFIKLLQHSLQRRSEGSLANDSVQTKLIEAGFYAVSGGGKHIRAILAYSAFNAASPGEDPSSADPIACAIELIHTYSLIHDDLPAMDDDDLRRGKPTLHKAYDEATAILVGDGLQARAFELHRRCTRISATNKKSILSKC